MDVLVAQARHSVLIIGVNLEGALPCVSTLLDLVRAGGRYGLPRWTRTVLRSRWPPRWPASIRPYDVRRSSKIWSCCAQSSTRLDAPTRQRITLVVSDRVLPVGVVGLDERARGGSLIVQHYLTATPAELAPLIWLRPERDQPWFTRYLGQCEACLAGAHVWEGTNA